MQIVYLKWLLHTEWSHILAVWNIMCRQIPTLVVHISSYMQHFDYKCRTNSSLRSLLAFDLRHWSMYCHPGNSWNSAATAITLVWGKLKSALIRHVCCQWSPYQRKKIKIIIPTNLFLHLHISKSCGLRVRGLLTSHKVSVK